MKRLSSRHFIVLAVFAALSPFFLLKGPKSALTHALFSRSPASSLLNQASPEGYLGRSDFKMLFVDWTYRNHFDVNEDVLSPSPKMLALESYRNAVLSSATQSLLPLVGQLTGQSTGTEPDLLTSLMTVSSAAEKILKDSLESPEVKAAIAKGVPFPVVEEIQISPWMDEKRDYFYRSEKLSTLGKHANVIGVDPSDAKYALKIVADTNTVRSRIAAAQAKAKANKTPLEPAFLLGSRLIYVLDGRAGHESENKLRLQLLLGLTPSLIPFMQTNDQVTLDRAVIPAIPPQNLASTGELGPVAHLTLDLVLDGSKVPQLQIDFGDLMDYQIGSSPISSGFRVNPATQKTVSPRLEGTAKIKAKATPIAINFSFQKMLFDLTKLQITDLDLLTSPGLRINNHNYVVGGFNVQSVETQFQGEINKTISAQIDAAKTQVKDKVQAKADQILPNNKAIIEAVQQILNTKVQK